MPDFRGGGVHQNRGAFTFGKVCNEAHATDHLSLHPGQSKGLAAQREGVAGWCFETVSGARCSGLQGPALCSPQSKVVAEADTDLLGPKGSRCVFPVLLYQRSRLGIVASLLLLLLLYEEMLACASWQ
jgi:hypothetical protein